MTVLERSVASSWPSRDDPLDWMASAACVGVPTDVFFPERGRSYATAKRICAGCAVIQECRDATDRIEGALRIVDVNGVFAGETPGQRLRRRHVTGAEHLTAS